MNLLTDKVLLLYVSRVNCIPFYKISMRIQKMLRFLLSIFIVLISSVLADQQPSRADNLQRDRKISPNFLNIQEESSEPLTVTSQTKQKNILPTLKQSTQLKQNNHIILQSTAQDLVQKSSNLPKNPFTNLPVQTRSTSAQDTVASSKDTPRSTPAQDKTASITNTPFRLVGWETAKPIGKDHLLLQFGGVSFNNPYDFRRFTGTEINRSNDAYLDLVYGLSNDTQISVGLSGKDDTIFAGLVRIDSQLQIINNTIPVQYKWRFYNQDSLQAAVVLGAEFPAPFSALFFRPRRSIEYWQRAANGVDTDRFFAPNNDVVLGVGLPISYQVNDRLGLHLNPRISLFPRNLAVTETTGDPNGLKNAGIGFDGQRIEYHGTVAGIGVGFSYALSPKLQVSADFTQILMGKNAIGPAMNGSLLSTQPVWNAGIQYSPNNRTALGVYVTNRFNATSASPSNLLAQPGGDYGFGLNVTYLPDFAGKFTDPVRTSYPTKAAFWNTATGFPSTTLPASSVFYQVGASHLREGNASVRLGLSDDFEIAVTHSNSNRRAMPIETGVFLRWGLLPDRGKSGLSGAFDLGLTRIDGQDLELGYSLYADSPISYRLPGNKLTFHATPKLVIPAQFQGVSNIFALSLGATWQMTDNTQIFGGITSSLMGDNQLVAGKTLSMNGNTPVYNLGIRQLFPNGNSTYGLEVYYTNGAGSSGYQAVSALPNGDHQFGIRFSLLNGTPSGDVEKSR